MEHNRGGKAIPEADLLTEIRVQLARIEETLKTLSALATTLEIAKETAKEALQAANNAKQRIDLLEPVKDTADEALRNANIALEILSRQEEDQKWFRRTFYGAIITAVGGGVVVAVWAAITVTGG